MQNVGSVSHLLWPARKGTGRVIPNPAKLLSKGNQGSTQGPQWGPSG